MIPHRIRCRKLARRWRRECEVASRTPPFQFLCPASQMRVYEFTPEPKPDIHVDINPQVPGRKLRVKYSSYPPDPAGLRRTRVVLDRQIGTRQ